MLTNEAVIAAKANCFKAGIYDVLTLSDKQIKLFEYLADKETEEILFGGAAGGAKSWGGCEWLLWSCLAYPETKWFIGRHHLTEIRESTVQTMFKVFAKHNIPAAYWKYNEMSVKLTFSNGSVIKGIEMMHKPSDPEFDSFGSTEYTGGWIEEGGGIAYKAKEVASTRIGRHYNDRYGIKGKLLVTGNPSRNWMYSEFYKPDKQGTLPAGKVFLRSLVQDNPFREEGYEERLAALTGTARARLYLGDWDYIDDPLALIDPDAIFDLFTNDYIEPDPTEKYLVVDVAMHGSDFLRGAIFEGQVLTAHEVLKKSGGLQVLQFVKAMQAKHGIRAGNVIYDADGVGAFLGGSGGFIPGAVAFHGNASPFIANKEETKRDRDRQQQQVSEYGNLKAQCGWLLANDINQGNMWAKAVTSQEDIEMLSEELSQIKAAKADSEQKLRLMSKDLVVRVLGRSPDFADLFLMRKYFDLRKMIEKKPFTRPIRAIG